MTQASMQDMGVGIGKFMGMMIWDAIPWVLLAGFAGLIAAIVLVVWLVRRKLLWRHTPGWNLLAKLGYVAILVALPIGSGIFAGVYAVHNRVDAGIESGLRPMVAAQMPPLRMYLAQEMKKAGSTSVTSIREMLKPFKRHIRYVPTSSGRWERYKAYWVNDVMVEPAFGVIADTVEEKLLEKLNQAGAKVAGDEEASRRLFSLGAAILVKQNAHDPADALRFDREITQVVMLNLFDKINQGFKPVYMSVWLPLLCIALLMLAEIMIYRRFYWPQRRGIKVAAAGIESTGVHPPLAG